MHDPTPPSESKGCLTCAACGEEFHTCTSKEEALEKLRDLWGEIPLSECGVVCDDCFKKIMAREGIRSDV